MVESCQDIAADLRLGQRGADGCRQADRLERGVHLERDPGADKVIGQLQAVRFGAGQHHGQALRLPDGCRDGAGQGFAVRPQGVDELAVAAFGAHGGQKGVEVLFSCHGASLGAGPRRGPSGGRPPQAAARTQTAAAPREGNGRRRKALLATWSRPVPIPWRRLPPAARPGREPPRAWVPGSRRPRRRRGGCPGRSAGWCRGP